MSYTTIGQTAPCAVSADAAYNPLDVGRVPSRGDLFGAICGLGPVGIDSGTGVPPVEIETATTMFGK
jgi:hypothetical protein